MGSRADHSLQEEKAKIVQTSRKIFFEKISLDAWNVKTRLSLVASGVSFLNSPSSRTAN
jgi:hypothetical protein